MGQRLRDEHGELEMSDIAERLRETFQKRRYGTEGGYDPDFDLLDVAADEIERLRTTIAQLRAVAGAVSVEGHSYDDIRKDLRMGKDFPNAS